MPTTKIGNVDSDVALMSKVRARGASNLSMTLLTGLNNALAVGPILMGTKRPAHIVAPTVTSRGIVNMSAIAAAEALEA